MKRPALAAAATVALVIAGLGTLDRFLAGVERADVEREARRNYLEGSRLLAARRASAAVDPLRKAHSLERGNAEYERELADALFQMGKIAGAEPLLDEVLQKKPNDGLANLIGARMALSKGASGTAESYYHRAIYGEWPVEAGAHRTAARLELVHLLAKQGRAKELLAELLPLEEEAKNRPEWKEELPALFLAAGSPSRAAEVYRARIARDGRDAEAYRGLGEAELRLGRYSAAQSAFLAAFRHKPEDASLRDRVELSSAMTALDPTPRQLPSMEKYRRAVRILELTRDALHRCGAHLDTEEADTEEPPLHVSNEVAEEKLSQAERLWNRRVESCGASASREEEQLRLIMEKLSQ